MTRALKYNRVSASEVFSEHAPPPPEVKEGALLGACPPPQSFHYSVCQYLARLLIGGGTAAEVPGCIPMWLSLLARPRNSLRTGRSGPGLC